MQDTGRFRRMYLIAPQRLRDGKRAAAALAVLAATIIGPGLSRAQSATAWPTFQGSMARTGYTAQAGPTTGAIHNFWPTRGRVLGSVVVDAKGTAYAADDAGYVYAFSPSKSTALWTFQASSPIVSTPTLSPDGGTLYVGSNDGTIYAISTSTGKQVWSQNMGGAIHASPVLSQDGGTLYVASTSGQISSFAAASGQLVKTGGFSGISIPGEISLTNDGQTLYAAGTTGILDGFATSDLSTAKPYYTQGNVQSAPALDQYNNIYVTTSEGYLDVYNQGNAQAAWTVQVGGGSVGSTSTPAVANNTVVFGANDGYVYAYSTQNHSLLWNYKTGAPVAASPIIAGNTVYVGSQDGFMYAFDLSSGRLLWTSRSLGFVFGSAAIGPDNSLWVGTAGDLVYRFHDMPNPPPPPSNNPTVQPPTATPVPTQGPAPTPSPTPVPTATATPPPAAVYGLGKVIVNATVRNRRDTRVRKGTTIKFPVKVQVKKDTAATSVRVNWAIVKGSKTVGHHGRHRNLHANQTGTFTFSWSHKFKYAGRYVVKITASVGNKTAHRSIKIIVVK